MNSNKQTQSVNDRQADRRGSILIFVVGILVLLALAATAYLTTARADRVTSTQNEYNVQIDLLVEGVRQAVLAKIVNDPSATTDLASVAPAGTYFCDSPALDTDPWIASRVPVTTTQGTPFNISTNEPMWRFISGNIFGGTTNAFEDPISGVKYSNRGKAHPRFNALGQPMLIFDNDVAGTDTTSIAQGPFVASDADYDGIPDSGLVHLPVGLLNGVSYYAGIRVIDNNSAVNVNTAFSRDLDYDGNGNNTLSTSTNGINAVPSGMFTASVGLRELLRTYDGTNPGSELIQSTTNRIGVSPYADTQVITTPATYDSTAAHVYRSIGDKLFHDLGRRTASPVSTATAFNLSDELSLAYRFALRDSTATQTQTETTFLQSLVGDGSLQYASVPITTFASTTAGINSWFSTLFDFGSEPTLPNTAPYWRPRRTLVTTANPQGMLVRGADMDGLIYASAGAAAVPAGTLQTRPSGAQSFQSVVRYQNSVVGAAGGGEQMHYYSPYSNSDVNFTNLAYEDLPKRCSINTAGFPELWRAYWNAMCNPLKPYELHPGSPQIANISVFNTNWTDRANWIEPTSSEADTDTPELLLRSGLAAVNVESLRSGGKNAIAGGDTAPQNAVIVRSIKMPIGPAAGPKTSYTINMFGLRRQPFITQAVVVTKPATPDILYEAVELFNPYDVDISLTNWRLVALAPAVPATNGYTPTEIAGPGATPATPLGIIKAHSFLVIASAAAVPGGTAIVAPPATIPAVIVAPLLATNINDIMLVRPRRGDGLMSTGDDVTTPDTLEPNEGTPTAPLLANLVPIDRMALPTGALTPNSVYLHQRPNIAATPWQFAYENVGNSWTAAGPLATTAISLGTFMTTVPTAPGGVTPLPPAPWPTIQLGNVNWPVNTLEPSGTVGVGLSQTAANVQMRFPFGGFSRLGELLEAPYMGSWTINTDAQIATGTTFIDSIPEPYDAFNCKFVAGADHDVGRFFDGSTGAMKTWCSGLLEFFTASNHPWDDYDVDGPNVLPDAITMTNYGTTHLPIATGQAAVQGLVNINTAPLKVLATLPWMPTVIDQADAQTPKRAFSLIRFNYTTTPPTLVANAPGTHVGDVDPSDATKTIPNDSESIAAAIVYFRDCNVNGGLHFEHISDLFDSTTLKYQPLATQLAVATTALTTTEPDDAQGDWTPLNPHTVPDPVTGVATASNTDLVRNDFEEKSLLLNRVSNLITTRSDTYTVYIDLQGWKNAGQGPGIATLVTERHAAMIVDRSGLSPSNLNVVATKVPAN